MPCHAAKKCVPVATSSAERSIGLLLHLARWSSSFQMPVAAVEQCRPSVLSAAADVHGGATHTIEDLQQRLASLAAAFELASGRPPHRPDIEADASWFALFSMLR